MSYFTGQDVHQVKRAEGVTSGMPLSMWHFLVSNCSPFCFSLCVIYSLYLTAQSDWTQKGLTLAGSKPGYDGPSLAEFHQHFEVVFVDPSGHLNLCADMNKAVFLRVSFTHWGRDKMAAIFLTTFSTAFSSMKMYEFHLTHWGRD